MMERRIPGGSSAVDILIATPGRLMDHLSGTTNFTLQHLRYLVRLARPPRVGGLARILARPPPRARVGRWSTRPTGF